MLNNYANGMFCTDFARERDASESTLNKKNIFMISKILGEHVCDA